MPAGLYVFSEGGGVSRLRLGLVIALVFVVFAVAFLSFSNLLIGEDYLKDFVLQQLRAEPWAQDQCASGQSRSVPAYPR